MPKLIPYKLTLEERSGYLWARVEAEETSATTSKAFLNDLRAECHARGMTRLMIDRQIPHVMSVIEFYNLSDTTVPILRGIRTAWINPFPENQEILEFRVTAENNRGASYSLFTDEREAEAWLLDRPAPEGTTSNRDEGDPKIWLRK